jgi:hypothetical protein
VLRVCATEGSAEGGSRKVVAAVYFLRLTVHRSSSEKTACVVASKQVGAASWRMCLQGQSGVMLEGSICDAAMECSP